MGRSITQTNETEQSFPVKINLLQVFWVGKGHGLVKPSPFFLKSIGMIVWQGRESSKGNWSVTFSIWTSLFW